MELSRLSSAACPVPTLREHPTRGPATFHERVETIGCAMIPERALAEDGMRFGAHLACPSERIAVVCSRDSMGKW